MNNSIPAPEGRQNFLLYLIIGGLILMSGVLIGWQFGGESEIKKTSGENNSAQSLEQGKEFLDLSNKDPEVGGVVEKVSRHILLPAREFTVATVNDGEKLRQSNPVLFQYVQTGQKLLIYETGAIVYDQVLDKVVDIIQDYPIQLQMLQRATASTSEEPQQ